MLPAEGGRRSRGWGAIVAIALAGATAAAWPTQPRDGPKQVPAPVESVKMEPVGGSSNACRCSLRIEPE